MQLRDFVLSTTRGDNPLNANLEGDSKKEDQGKITDFLTLQSLTYTGSMLAIGAIWTFARMQATNDFTNGPIIPVVLAALLMAAGVGWSWSDLKNGGKRFAAIVIAAFNALLLVAGAFGITVAGGPK